MTDRPTDRPTAYAFADLFGILNREDERYKQLKKGIIPRQLLEQIFTMDGAAPVKAKALFGTVRHKEKGVETSETSKRFDFSRYRYLINAPFKISNKCCDVMKKSPIKIYAHANRRKAITGQMASESRLRTLHWLKNGCNAFEAKDQISNPMAFWTEQDVLLYLYNNKIPIASVYGDIVIDFEGQGQVEGQMSFRDLGGDWELFDSDRPLLKTTGCSRTGCMFCGYGCHLEKPGEGRFERMKVTHPKQYDYIMRPKEQGGLGYKEVIDWINEHGNLHIRY